MFFLTVAAPALIGSPKRLLRWEPGGFVLYSKHLEKGTYSRPAITAKDGVLSWPELVLMIEADAAREL